MTSLTFCVHCAAHGTLGVDGDDGRRLTSQRCQREMGPDDLRAVVCKLSRFLAWLDCHPAALDARDAYAPPRPADVPPHLAETTAWGPDGDDEDDTPIEKGTVR